MVNKIIVNLKSKIFSVEIQKSLSLFSKGYGSKDGDVLFLDVYEVYYLLEKEKISIIKGKKFLTKNDFKKFSFFNYVNYLVYKDLRNKGYLVKSGFKFGFVFRVYEKGIKIGDDHSLWLVDIFLENEKFNFKNLIGKNRVAHNSNKKMLFAIVDDDFSITYIENSWKRV